ncbi:hypothetical protein GGH94_001422 [Coemansia aciculifera]|uniref:Rab-GAP TBC domain-containing protein n=1 Tax=Coemansia aciculifera TaxID=417176 RepID=A0A9W8IQX0_9FUNG|nr:hypothetical protein GGH94_001422 [Coemansia aciculifera]
MAATLPLELAQTSLGNSTDTKAGYSLPASSESLAAGALVASSATVALVDRDRTERTRESAATLSMPSEVDGIVGVPLVSATAMGDNVRHERMAVTGDSGQQKSEQSQVSSSAKGCNDCCPLAIVPVNNSQELAYDLPSDIGSDNRRNNIAGAKRLSDRNYADRFGSYYEYTAAIVEDDNKAPLESARADHIRLPRQRRQNGVPAHRSPPHLPLPKIPPPLRSTYKSEPVMQGRGDLCDPRNSYSQTLENALFYSQAIRQIRETDCVDASDPYAVAVPRARPGKEDIRQRRARNVIASREVFSITTPSAFIPLPSAGKNGAGMWAMEAMPKLPSSIERSLAMRSEPAIKLAAGKQKAGNGTAVPITRMLPPATAARPTVEDANVTLASNNIPTTASGFFSKSYDHGSVGRSGGGEAQETAWEAARRAGIDQPLPTAAEFAEGLKQRGVNMPRTAASSIITSRSVQLRQRQRPYSTAESAVVVFGSDEEEDDEDGEYVAIPGGKRTSIMTQTSRTQFRLSMASHFSLASGVDQQPQPEAQQQPEHQQQGRRTQVSSHSRQVATRLLMRAGFSSIAIRVARLGRAPVVAAMAASTLTRSHGTLIASAESDTEESDAGVELDPNGLQTLRAERRKQVKRIDEYGFLQFEGDEERPSEYAQQYEAWRERRTRGRSRAGGLLSDEPRLAVGSEAKWETLLRSFDSATLRGSRRVKQLVQAGVPARMRAQVYYTMSGASKLERGDEYARLLALEPVPIFDVIERDVARCYPDHAMFTDAEGVGQRQLRRILRAYAQYNPGVGYCQGMGRLVGLFLIVGLSEEQAFWVLAATIANYIPQYYVPDLCGLRVHTAVFEALLAERSPRLHAHLADEGCDALMYATPWFMTVFTLSLPWPAALRVWDWFMFRGTKVLFRVALAITDLAAAYLLEACPSITELLGFLLHIPHSLVDADALIAAASKVKISERHIERLTGRLSARLCK